MGKLAALSSGLLARKGQARPAMRPQGFTHAPGSLDDLGWNDMGQMGGGQMGGGQMGGSQMGGQPASQATAPQPVAEQAPPAPLPPVLVARAELEAQIEPAAPEPEPAAVADVKDAPVASSTPARRSVSVATAERLRRESGKATARGKAAFTLRLDGERHLRLRLASALAGRSAQALVTDAVDAFLQTVPEVEALVAQLPPAKRRQG